MNNRTLKYLCLISMCGLWGLILYNYTQRQGFQNALKKESASLITYGMKLCVWVVAGLYVMFRVAFKLDDKKTNWGLMLAGTLVALLLYIVFGMMVKRLLTNLSFG